MGRTQAGPDAARTPGRPVRADALRNRARLLAAAHSAFGEQGTDASLEDIARSAGLGIGTLYRHFPTREALVEALIGEQIESLVTLADRLLAAEEPGEGLLDWLRAVISHATSYRGLAASLMAGLHDTESELNSACDGMLTAGTALLRRAQESGEVRADVTVEELFTLANAIAWSVEQGVPGDPARVALAHADRMLTLTMEGLTPRP